MAGIVPPEVPDDRDNTSTEAQAGEPPLRPRATGTPLPAPWPESAPQTDEDAPDSLVEAPPTLPTVAPSAWLDEPRYWLADYQRVPRPPTRPLDRPVRFRRPSFWRSALALGALAVAIVVTGTGALVAVRAGQDIFKSAAPATPTVTPHPSPTPTLAPTATPKPKKARK